MLILEVPRRLHLVEARPSMLNQNPTLPCASIDVVTVCGAICTRRSTSCRPVYITVIATHSPIPAVVVRPWRRYSLRDRSMILRLVCACILIPVVASVYRSHFLIGDRLFSVPRGIEIDEESKNVASENQGDNPFEDCADILVFLEGTCYEDYGHSDYDVSVLVLKVLHSLGKEKTDVR